MPPKDVLNATLVKRIEVAPGLVIFCVKPHQGVPSFEPGQYVALGLPGSAPRPAEFPAELTPSDPDKYIKRSYSVASSPLLKDFLEFYIAIVPTGALTSRLAGLREGSQLHCAPKIVGTFVTKDVDPGHDLILVSTGTGVAPFLAMVRTAHIWTPGRRITVMHGVRYAQDLAYREELEALARNNPNFSYHAIVSRSDPRWNGHQGYVQHLFERGVVTPDPSRQHVFLCGNPKMVEDVTAVLVPKGYKEHSRRDPGNLHLEKYW